MENLDAAAVARLLTELGQLMEICGDSPFKARAYHLAAESLKALTAPLDEVIAAGGLRSIPGVGAAIAEKIESFHRTGGHRTLDRLRADIPAAALDILAIPGLPAPKARQIVQDLKIRSLEELEEACRGDRLKDVKGLGPAIQQRILQGIGIMRRSQGQRHLHRAGELLDSVAANLRASRPDLGRIVPAGDYRRGCELVHDLSLAAEMPDAGPEIGSIRINDEVQLYAAAPPLFGAALILATGSSDHLEALQDRARSRGLSLDLQGLRRGGELIPCPEERAVYAALDLPFIESELREGGDEIALAAEGRLPDLVTQADLRGILHSHTDRSDGGATLSEMAEATRQRGFSYFGVADHSKSAGYAGGLSVAEIEAQQAEADNLNRSYRGRFRILKGIESDILVDGSLDYPDEILDRFDFVVASVHSRFNLDEEAQTERIIRAVSDPHTTILGHMTGRLLLRRDGYQLDIERVLQACAEHGVAVEINANPHRLDLDWRWHRRALELGCMLSINPDAHSVAELDLLRWGVAMARKGGVPKERVLNAMALPEITAFLAERHRRRAKPRSSRA